MGSLKKLVRSRRGTARRGAVAREKVRFRALIPPAVCVAVPVLFALLLSCAGPSERSEFDVILRGGTVYDGLGGAPVVADVALNGDRIAAVGDLSAAMGKLERDVSGLAVSPGFVNMLSWATLSLLEDGTGLGDLVQGVTLEVFGEGQSMGPVDEASKQRLVENAPYPIDVDWTTLGGYLESLERRGVAMNVASFVGATTVRTQVVGYDDRPPSSEELEAMRGLVRTAMEEGALGVGSSLIYPPAFFASTEELIELCRVASEYGGMYISHMRSEGDRLLEGVDELIRIAREADIAAEIYHLKAAGESNWSKLDQVIERIDAAHAEGLEIYADMYLYTAGATGLTASLPPWVQEGGFESMLERLRTPSIRRRVEAEMTRPGPWENLLLSAGDPSRVLIVGVDREELKPLLGRNLAEISEERGTTPPATVVDLILEDETRVEAVYFLMSEENLVRQIQLPYMAFGSDAGAMAPREPFTNQGAHPRAYGNFARLLGRYVREQQVISLEETIRRLTSLPSRRLGLPDRGVLEPGAFADVAVFSPDQVADRATFEAPHQLAVGMHHVFVNGRPSLLDGEATGEKPGRVLRGPGWLGWSQTSDEGEVAGSTAP